MMKVTITKEWLKACGYKSDGNRTFEVIKVLGQLPDKTSMYVVDFNGRPWTIAEWRCEGPAH